MSLNSKILPFFEDLGSKQVLLYHRYWMILVISTIWKN